MVDRLPRCERSARTGQPGTSIVLLGRRDGALQGASADHPLSFSGSVADTVAPAGTRWDRGKRGVSHRNRPARRSWLTGSLRYLLWDGRQPDWRGTPGCAGVPAAWRNRRPAGSKGVVIMKTNT